MLTVLLCVVVCACVVAICSKWQSKPHALPPAYPGGLPFIGHTHLLLTDSASLWSIVQDSAKHAFNNGGVNHWVIGMQTYYMIADAEDALTASNACLQKHFAYDFAKPWLGDGLLTSPEPIWKRHRKLLQPAFSLPIIHGFLNVFNSQARKLVAQMELHIGKGHFNPADYLKKIALETFCQGAFGINATEDKDLTENYMASVDTVLDIATRRFQTFWLHSDLLFRLSGLQKRERDAVDSMNRMSNEIMHRKKVAMKNTLVNNSDDTTTDLKYKPVLDLMLELSADGSLTDKEIREEMNTIITAGFETISNQLMYTLLLLGENPDAQNKMFAEIIEVVGPERDVDKDDINRLVYINAVIMESLRMLPSAPVLLRYVDKDVKLKNYIMPAGSQCALYPFAYRHDPRWGPSPDQFLPERWLHDPELCGKKEFAGFGLGKRACIGRQYAMISMKVFLAHFVRLYKVTADMSQLKLKCDFIVKPVSGNEISVQKRN